MFYLWTWDSYDASDPLSSRIAYSPDFRYNGHITYPAGQSDAIIVYGPFVDGHKLVAAISMRLLL